MNKLPVLFIFFNRIDEALLSFDKIKEYQPDKLYLSSDGGRDVGEHKLVIELRNRLLKKIDWECQVYHKFEDYNLGCKDNVGSAVKWFFNNVEKGVVIEDDIMVNDQFFQFMTEMLNKFHNDFSIQMISGFNYAASVKFSSDVALVPYPNIWSWGSWGNRFSNYTTTVQETDIQLIQDTVISKNKKVSKYLLKLFRMIKNGDLNTWDYQILLLMISPKRLTIIPKYPLCENIGFGINATHTVKRVVQEKSTDYWYPDTNKIDLNNEVLIRHIEDNYYNGMNIFLKVFKKLKGIKIF
jgi:hypothetical protein